ncbi:PNK3P-domain-containing protein [Dacryopinax primogenitus]|uniref:PNK3P-domain-containing protein n=1 Tax=Dacryopinax primogenitus (strain DJM 731) TaxID=1858805 RepID=M5G624_DACPD|nr:PNK3P-domain-containing protein [Dacryopinax primogenitus]EJU05701.1 PNK3P-domain-containing protein [Dacryopinax primogenitus]
MPSKNSTSRESNKRSIAELTPDSSQEHPSKKAKSDGPKAVFSIFNKPDAAQPNPTSPITWYPPLGERGTCQHGIHLTPPSRSKIAAFDLDGTLIEPKSGAKFAKDHMDWRWWGLHVLKKVKEAHTTGYSVVIFTNQSQAHRKATIGTANIAEWKKKVGLVASALGDIPFQILAANAKDEFRKPMTGMWDAVVNVFKKDGVDIDYEASFFVGDAAGRQGDHSGVDRKFADNVGIRFYVPEEYFNGRQIKLPPLKGFHPRMLPAQLPLFAPSSSALLPTPAVPEIVLFVGPPASGKTSFFRKHFEPFKYQHVNQDTLKTRAKCMQMVEKVVREGHGVVVDNTNRDKETRKEYVALAEKLGVPIRCLSFNVSIALGWHNNLYRAFCLASEHRDHQKREMLPYSAFASFTNQMEEPDLSEGFKEIREINWVFEGNDEERKRWNRWLEL